MTQQHDDEELTCVECGELCDIDNAGVSYHVDQSLDLEHVAIPDELDNVLYGSGLS